MTTHEKNKKIYEQLEIIKIALTTLWVVYCQKPSDEPTKEVIPSRP